MTTYLDHAATTPMRASAVEAMMPFLSGEFGNPTGSHAVARRARQAIDEARDVVADALGADPREVVFTSGGTESDNLAILGAHGYRPGRVLASAFEHHAVIRVVEHLGGSFIPVTREGLVDLDALAQALSDDVSVVSVMTVNNEVGTLQPISQVSRLINKLAPNAKLHTDAAQAVAWIDIAEATRFADLVSFSAHKFGGPQGIGALIARGGTILRPQIHGGGQEQERRSGTHNVAGIVAMAAALRETVAERDATVARIARLRDRLVNEVVTRVPNAFETVGGAAAHEDKRVAGTAHITVPGVESEALLILLDDMDVYASAGASCSSGALEPSHVLMAMGFDAATANSGLRLTLGRTTTDADIDRAVDAISRGVDRLSTPIHSGGSR